MRHSARFPNPVATGESRPQLPNRLQVFLGMLFVLSLVTAATFFDQMAFAGAPATLSSRTGLAVSVGACVLLLAFSRRKWPLLLCALLFASIRMPNAWFGSSLPESLYFLVDCLAVSIALSAIIFRTEIAEVLSRTRSPYKSNRPGAQASAMAESQALATLSHARAATAPMCTVEPLSSSPA
jgi:hypothetical protein